MIHEDNNGTKHISKESAAVVAIFPEMFQKRQSFYFLQHFWSLWSNMGYTSETHLELKSREILIAHNLFRRETQ